LIIRKIIKINATRCHILTLKCTKFDSRRVRPLVSWMESEQARFSGVAFPAICYLRNFTSRATRAENNFGVRFFSDSSAWPLHKVCTNMATWFCVHYSRQAGVSGFWCHQQERSASPRRVCAVTRGFRTTTQESRPFCLPVFTVIWLVCYYYHSLLLSGHLWSLQKLTLF